MRVSNKVDFFFSPYGNTSKDHEENKYMTFDSPEKVNYISYKWFSFNLGWKTKPYLGCYFFNDFEQK